MGQNRNGTNYGSFDAAGTSTRRPSLFTPFLKEKKGEVPGPSDQSFERPAPPLPKFEEDCCPATIPNDAVTTGSLIARDYYYRGYSSRCENPNCLDCCTIRTRFAQNYSFQSDRLGVCHITNCFADGAEYYLHVLPQKMMYVKAMQWCGTNYERAQCCDWDRACCVFLCCARVPCFCCASATKCTACTLGCIPNALWVCCTQYGTLPLTITNPLNWPGFDLSQWLSDYLKLSASERNKIQRGTHNFLCRHIVEDEKSTVPLATKIAALNSLAKSSNGFSILSPEFNSGWIANEREIPREKDNYFVKALLRSTSPDSPALLEFMLYAGQARKFLSPAAREDIAMFFDQLDQDQTDCPGDVKDTSSSASSPPNTADINANSNKQSKEMIQAKVKVLEKFDINSKSMIRHEYRNFLLFGVSLARPLVDIIDRYVMTVKP